MSIKKTSNHFFESVETLISHNIDIKNIDLEHAIFDYSQKKAAYYLNILKHAFEELSRSILELPQLIKHDIGNKPIVEEINKLFDDLKAYYKQKNLSKLLGYAQKIHDLSKKLNIPKHVEGLSIKIPRLPIEIKDEVTADLKEIEKCFNNDCLRSSIILCGRVLETSLHRKYFDATGNDLLEKSPGIGLGRIIAKLQEQGVNLPSGLTQQIHLINQTRIFTVHKKQAAFFPTKQQAHAIILFTIDTLEKLF